MKIDEIASLILIFSIFIAVFLISYTVILPHEGEHFTNFYILNKNRVASGYPTEITIGKSEIFIIGITNYEYRDINYLVEIYLTNETFNITRNSTTIENMKLINSLSASLSHNNTKEWDYIFTIRDTGYNRIELLLFKEEDLPLEAEGQDRINASYHELYIHYTMKE